MRPTDPATRPLATLRREVRPRVAARVAAGAAVAALLLACGGGGSSTGPAGGSGGMMSGSTGAGDAVTVGNNKFTPATLTVLAGTTVTWQWSSGGVVHNVTFADGATSGNRSAGSYQRTFSGAGRYAYQCTIHGAVMSGSVVVQ